MSDRPLISLVTCTYNCMEDIEKTIESVAVQEFLDYEHVVVDGDSIDGTKNYLSEIYEKGRLSVFISEEDNGIYDALNKGVEASTGEIVGILHAGTTLQPGALAELARIIGQVGKEKVIAGSAGWRRNGTLKKDLRSNIPPLSSKNTKILHESIFVPRYLYDEIGLYDTKYKISSDYDWISRAEAAGKLAPVYTDKIMICYEGGWGFSGLPENEKRKIKEHLYIAKKHVGYVFAYRRYIFRLGKLALKRVLGHGR